MRKVSAFCLWALLYCLFGQAGLAQRGLNVPNFTVHSPDVTALGTYGEYPVDFSTGVVPIGIPLYTAKGTRLEIPVSISYHSGGIKLDQEASSIGLGWVLNAGGVVTRAIRGRVDESAGFATNYANIPDSTSITDSRLFAKIGNSLDLKSKVTADFEPDVFSVSANGLNAEFCLDNTGKYVTNNYEPLTFTRDIGNKLIVVRDKTGNIYRFGRALDGTSAYEESALTFDRLNTGVHYTDDTFAGDENYVSAWFLTEIISADLSDTISFKYVNNLITDYRVTSATRYTPRDQSSSDAIGDFFEGGILSGTKSYITSKTLSSILYKNGRIEFSTVGDRLDCYRSDSRLRTSEMTVYGSKGERISKVEFDNAGYFERTAGGSNINPGIAVPDYKRKSLKLGGVKFYDRDNQFINDYKFTYDLTPLAARNTTSQDYWGYYNGQMVGNLIASAFVGYKDSRPVYIGGNRKADFNFMKAASLTKITYPTGGATVFEYEPNRYLNRDIPPRMVEVDQERELKAYAVNRLPDCPLGFMDNVPQNNTVDFTITDTLKDNVADGRIVVYISDYKTPASAAGMTVKISDLNSSIGYNYQLLPADRLQGKTFYDLIRIQRGHTYRVEAFTNGATGSNSGPCNSPYIEVGIYYKYYRTTTADSVVPEQAGGLRIKSVTNLNSDSSVASKRMYEYGDSIHPIGYGELITNPNRNFFIYPQLYATSSYVKTLVPVVWYTSESQVELGMAHGCPVDYGRVVEKQIDVKTGKDNGKSEYFYSSVDGDFEPKTGYKYPYNTIYYPSWKQQKFLLKTIHYKWENDVYKPVKQIVNNYAPVTESKIKIFKLFDYQPDIWYSIYSVSMGNWVWINSYNNPERFLYYNYYVSRGRYLLTGETTTTYIEGGDSIQTVKSLRYNPQYDLGREITTNSTGQQIMNDYRYSADLDYAGLISRNVLSLPVQQEQFIDGKIRSGSILRYNVDGNISERYQLEVVAPTTPLTYTQQAIVPSYYAKKEVLSYYSGSLQAKEVLDGTGRKTVYLWSYKGQNLIAEIRNADYATVEGILGSVNITNMAIANPTNSEVNTFLMPLRTATQLKTAMITTYTFDPALGVTSITNPTGLSSYYEYDGFGRLKVIKDHNGKILKQVDYQYMKPVNQ